MVIMYYMRKTFFKKMTVKTKRKKKKLRQEDCHQFTVNLGYIAKSCLGSQIQNQIIKICSSFSFKTCKLYPKIAAWITIVAYMLS